MPNPLKAARRYVLCLIAENTFYYARAEQLGLIGLFIKITCDVFRNLKLFSKYGALKRRVFPSQRRRQLQLNNSFRVTLDVCAFTRHCRALAECYTDDVSQRRFLSPRSSSAERDEGVNCVDSVRGPFTCESHKLLNSAGPRVTHPQGGWVGGRHVGDHG